MKKLLNIFVAIIMCFSVVLACTSCEKTNCKKGWTVLALKAGENSVLNTATFNVTKTSGSSIKEIWINVSELKNDNVEIKYLNSSVYNDTNAQTVKITYKMIEDSKDGWICLADGKSYTGSYISIANAGFVKINELIVIDSTNTRCNLKFYKCRVTYRNEKNELQFSGDEDKTAEWLTTNLSYFKNGSPYNLIDEQDKFTVKEIEVIEEK